MRILVLGGSGSLGTHLCNGLKDRNIVFDSPSSAECDITNPKDKYFRDVDIVIHSAGYVNTMKAEQDREKCIDVNVLGTNNVVSLCRKFNKRLVYISSEYVFSGKISPYTAESGVDPINVYGMTKACGELLVKTLSDYLIIRSPFIRDTIFNHKCAFHDQYTNRQYVHEIVDDILSLSIEPIIGVKHIVGKHQSVLELAKQTKNDIVGVSMPDSIKGIVPCKLELR